MPAKFFEFYSDVAVFQTVTISPPTAGTAYENDAGPYNAGDTVDFRIYSFKDTPGGRIFSATYEAVSVSVIGVGLGIFIVWSEAAGVDGYRILRNLNGGGFVDWQDAIYDDQFNDDGFNWLNSPTVTPTSSFDPCTSGTNVSKLEDQSGNARHLLQTTDANRHQFTSSGALNGHNPINCNGSTSRLLSLAGLSGFGVGTLLLVCKPTSGAADLDGFRLDFGGLVSVVGLGGWTARGTASNSPYVDSNIPHGTAAQIVTAIFNGASSSIQVNETAPVTGSISAHAPATLEIRGHTAGMDFFALVGYAAVLNTAQIAYEVNRLQARYAL